MASLKPITVVGGGLAGLTLGIGLRRCGIPVTVWEASRYPRHRVCGEFVSGNGLAVLDRLDLRPRFEEAGAVPVLTARFIAGQNQSPVRHLPAAAMGLSRHSMDALLADEFRRLGGDLREQARWTSQGGDGIIRASGRRAQATERGWRWFGLKAHARNVDLAADLEMHVSSGGYVGVNRINGGAVNVCGLFRARPGEAGLDSGFELLRGQPGSPLRERLAAARFDDDSYCSVAGLSLKPRHAHAESECRIGDALTMIAPVTGNGMSMAFESAELAVEPLASYSRGESSWTEAQRTVAWVCDRAFSRRLAWAGFLQGLMFCPSLQGAAGAVVLRSDRLWRMMFAKTR